jgi:hypothetical protein
MLVIAALAVATVSSTMIASTDQANAQFRRWGPAAFVGAAVVTGAIIASQRECGWVRQFDRRGNYMGRVWACNY